MDGKESDRFVDELLDASLKRYQTEEPRAGLDNRILANLRASDRAAQSRRERWTWALGASAAVLAVAAVILYIPRQRSSDTRTISPASRAVAPKLETPKIVAAAPPRTRIPLKPALHVQSVPGVLRRPEQFPSVTRLDEQEKLLLLYVQIAPKSILTAQTNKNAFQDLEIQELKIADLQLQEMPRLQ